MKPFAILALAATALTGCTADEKPAKPPEAPPHGRMLVLDTHLDTPTHFDRQGWSFADRHGPDDDLVQLKQLRHLFGADAGCRGAGKGELWKEE